MQSFHSDFRRIDPNPPRIIVEDDGTKAKICRHSCGSVCEIIPDVSPENIAATYKAAYQPGRHPVG